MQSFLSRNHIVFYFLIFLASTPSYSQNQAIMVKDICPSLCGSNPYSFAVLDDTLYFFASNTVDNNRALWKTDGTSEGSTMLKDFFRTGLDIVNYHGVLYFFANAETDNYTLQLWRSDGTETGTYIVKNIDPAWVTESRRLFILNDKMVFAGASPAEGVELWASDGTETGTYMIEDLIQNPNYNITGNIAFTNELLLFPADDGVLRGMARSDGTPEGTFMLKDVSPNTHPGFMASYKGQIYFTAYKAGTNLPGLYKTDGTADGTLLVKEDFPSGTNPFSLQVINNELLFFVGAGPHELWKTDGTTIEWVKNLYVEGLSTKFNEKIYFSASENGDDYELWTSDGTDEGTHLVKDINPVGDGSHLHDMYEYKNKLYFGAQSGTVGDELWATDGTPEGTQLIEDISPGPDYSVVHGFFTYNDSLFFSANTGSGFELFRLRDSDLPLENSSAVKEHSLLVYAKNDVLYISAENLKPGFLTIEILPFSGQSSFKETSLILHSSLKKELNIASLSPGIYLVKVVTEKGILYSKFIQY